MSEPRFPFTPPQSVHDRFEAELKARVGAANAERNNKAAAEAKWAELQLTPEQKQYRKRWEGVQLKKGISSIPLTAEQVKDVLDLLGMKHLPEDGDYLLVGGAKLKIWEKGIRCSLAGYHSENADLSAVVDRIRGKRSLRPDEMN